jgi:hypothetical protein
MDKTTYESIQSDINAMQHRLQLADKIQDKITGLDSTIKILKDSTENNSLEDIYSIVKTFTARDNDPVVAGKIAASIVCCLEQYKDELEEQYKHI